MLVMSRIVYWETVAPQNECGYVSDKHQGDGDILHISQSTGTCDQRAGNEAQSSGGGSEGSSGGSSGFTQVKPHQIDLGQKSASEKWYTDGLHDVPTSCHS